MNPLDPQLMSIVIGIGNPLSALLTGPLLTRLGARPSTVRRAQGAGWIVLAIAQVAFVAFGVVSGLVGFRYAQPVMLLVATANFLVWWNMRPRKGGERDASAQPVVRTNADATSRWHLAKRG